MQRRKHDIAETKIAVPYPNVTHISGDKTRSMENNTNANVTEQAISSYADEQHTYSYQFDYVSHKIRKVKCVEFDDKVLVIHVVGGEVLGESTEPLKKEVDQQMRNKAMRQGHSSTFFTSNKDNVYIPPWLSK